jgi:hypothetical protein
MNNQEMYSEHLVRYTEHFHTNFMEWKYKNKDLTNEFNKSQHDEDLIKSRAVVHPGRKFDKISFTGSVMAFVAKVDGVHKGIPYRIGDVFKSATRLQPAKHVRGSIFANQESYDLWNRWTGPMYMDGLKRLRGIN